MDRQPIVYVVDDNLENRNSTGVLLHSAGMACEMFQSAEEFLDNYEAQQPGCLILDASLFGLEGMDLVSRLRAQGAHIPTLIVSGTCTIPQVVEGLKLGVVDFLEKPANPDVLLNKIRLALNQDAQHRAKIAVVTPIAQKFSRLTARERELLDLLVHGLSNKQVAKELNISVKTAENHRAKMMHKTGAHNAADLVRMAMLVAME